MRESWGRSVKAKPKILHLTLYRKWFDEIANGTKRVEYRAQTPYWRKRLVDTDLVSYVSTWRRFDEVHFRNGYAKNAPFMRVKFRHTCNDGDRYAIHLGKVLEIRNWP